MVDPRGGRRRGRAAIRLQLSVSNCIYLKLTHVGLADADWAEAFAPGGLDFAFCMERKKNACVTKSIAP